MGSVWSEAAVAATPVAFARFGCAVGGLCPGESVALACADDRSARALLGAMASGIQSAGVQALDFGCAWRAYFAFCAEYTACPLGVYVPYPQRGSVQVLGASHRMLDRLRLAPAGEVPAARYGERISAGGIQGLYFAQLLRRAPSGLGGTRARVRCMEREAEELLLRALASLGCEVGRGPVYSVSADGTRLSITDGSLSFTPERVWDLAERTGYHFGQDALQLAVHLLGCQHTLGLTLRGLAEKFPPRQEEPTVPQGFGLALVRNGPKEG